MLLTARASAAAEVQGVGSDRGLPASPRDRNQWVLRTLSSLPQAEWGDTNKVPCNLGNLPL